MHKRTIRSRDMCEKLLRSPMLCFYKQIIQIMAFFMGEQAFPFLHLGQKYLENKKINRQISKIVIRSRMLGLLSINILANIE